MACARYSKPINYSGVQYTLTLNYIVAVAHAPYLDIEQDDTDSSRFLRQFFMITWDKFDGRMTHEDLVKQGESVGYTYRVEKLWSGLLSPIIIANDLDPENKDNTRLSDVVSILQKGGKISTIRLGRSVRVEKKRIGAFGKDSMALNQNDPDVQLRFLGNFWSRKVSS